MRTLRLVYGAFLLSLFLVLSGPPASAQSQGASPTGSSQSGEMESVTIFPVFDDPFFSSEHPKGSEDELGNQLGRDFIVMRFRTQEVPFPHAHRNDGRQNQDWYGWREEVLAPVDGAVTDIRTGAPSHAPGHLDRNHAANSITFTRDDGLKVLYAHVREIQVVEGDSVAAGDVVARLGNNGPSFMPHLHVGAWKNGQPYQIQVDLAAMGRFTSYGPKQ